MDGGEEILKEVEELKREVKEAIELLKQVKAELHELGRVVLKIEHSVVE